jgi:small basic protein (TIGR04137 family)
MSTHPSLRTAKSTRALRNVLKRYQRVRHMMERGTWTDGRSVFGLPKIKQARVKARKVAKEEKKEKATTPETAAKASPASK